jgi:hypothetical protein
MECDGVGICIFGITRYIFSIVAQADILPSLRKSPNLSDRSHPPTRNRVSYNAEKDALWRQECSLHDSAQGLSMTMTYIVTT